jgi:hypothetical protein
MATKTKGKKSATRSGKKTAKKASPKRRGRKFGDTGPRQGGN